MNSQVINKQSMLASYWLRRWIEQNMTEEELRFSSENTRDSSSVLIKKKKFKQIIRVMPVQFTLLAYEVSFMKNPKNLFIELSGTINYSKSIQMSYLLKCKDKTSFEYFYFNFYAEKYISLEESCNQLIEQVRGLGLPLGEEVELNTLVDRFLFNNYIASTITNKVSHKSLHVCLQNEIILYTLEEKYFFDYDLERYNSLPKTFYFDKKIVQKSWDIIGYFMRITFVSLKLLKGNIDSIENGLYLRNEYESKNVPLAPYNFFNLNLDKLCEKIENGIR